MNGLWVVPHPTMDEVECEGECAAEQENPPDRGQTKLFPIWGAGKNNSV